MVLMRLPQRFIDLFRLSILDHEGLAFRCDKRNEGPITFLVFPAADCRLWCGYGDENPGHCFGGCWRWPGAIGGLLFQTLPISARESVIIGALFFVGAAILWFVRPPDDKMP